MYYHVIASFRAEKAKRVLMADLTERELKKKFISPYKKGGKILCDNEIIDLMNLDFVQVIRTNELIDKVISVEIEKAISAEEEFNRDSSLVLIGSILTVKKEDIVSYGEDVTKNYLTEASGAGTIYQKYYQVLNSPWILSVGGGLVLLLIGAAIGLGVK